MIANKEAVKDLIPQKAPFVMVDELVQYSEDSLIANFRVTSDNIFTQNDLFLESGVVENMAQSVALHTGYQFFLLDKPAPTGYIGSIKSIEVKRLPKLNEVLETSVTILHEFMGVTLVDITVTIQEEEVAKGQMKTVLAK